MLSQESFLGSHQSLVCFSACLLYKPHTDLKSNREHCLVLADPQGCPCHSLLSLQAAWVASVSCPTVVCCHCGFSLEALSPPCLLLEDTDSGANALHERSQPLASVSSFENGTQRKSGALLLLVPGSSRMKADLPPWHLCNLNLHYC